MVNERHTFCVRLCEDAVALPDCKVSAVTLSAMPVKVRHARAYAGAGGFMGGQVDAWVSVHTHLYTHILTHTHT